MPRRLERTIDLALPVARVWELCGFTAEMDRLAGKPRGAFAPADEAAPVHLRHLVARRFGVPVEWDEAPWEFERGRFLQCHIAVARGPVAWMSPRLDLAAQGSGTRVRVAVEYEPAPGFRGWFAGVMAGSLLRGFVRAVQRTGARALALPEADPWATALPTTGDPEVAGRVRAVLAEVPAHDDVDRALLDRLALHVASTNDADLARIRPFALARRWGADPERVLSALLRAAKAGALALEWALLCPDCQRAASSGDRLDALRSSAHCDTCVVTFDADFAENVELVFRPAPSVREIDTFPYCLDNPSRMQGCAAMHVVAPGESRRLEVSLEPGA
jgi:hypothetical protein